jgi:hypothetical protein
MLFSMFSIENYAQTEEKGEEGFEHHCLFEEKSMTIGLGTSYSFELESVGINSRVYYNLGEHLCMGPEFSYFKKGEETVYDFDLVAHYIFETKFAGLYPLAGFNYTIEENEHHTEKEAGCVFGAGAHRNFNKLTVFLEYAHVESKLADDFITVGLMINLK